MKQKYINCNKNEKLCGYYISNKCPNDCFMALRIKKGISHKSKIGLERFLERYPEWSVVK